MATCVAARIFWRHQSAPAACAPAPWRGLPMAWMPCAGRCAKNFKWAPIKSRSWPPGASPRRPTPLARSATAKKKSAPSSMKRSAKAAMCWRVPTPVTYDALATEGEQYGLGPESLEKLLRVRDAGLGSLEIFKAAGVKMGFCSDLLGPSQRLQSEEFRLRRQVQSAAEVLTSATSIGAEVLDMRDRLGLLAANAWADLLVVDGNPLRDIGCLLGQGQK